MLLPPEVIEKIKKERERQQPVQVPLQPEIPTPKDRLENPKKKPTDPPRLDKHL